MQVRTSVTRKQSRQHTAAALDGPVVPSPGLPFADDVAGITVRMRVCSPVCKTDIKPDSLRCHSANAAPRRPRQRRSPHRQVSPRHDPRLRDAKYHRNGQDSRGKHGRYQFHRCEWDEFVYRERRRRGWTSQKLPPRNEGHLRLALFRGW